MSLTNPIPKLREDYLKKKRNKKLFQYATVFFLLALIIGILSYVSHRPEMNISKIELSGGILVTQGDVETLGLEYLQGSYLFVFPVKNSFWYPRRHLENYLKESFKRIDTIDISLKNYHTLSINITEKKPYAIWCASLPGVKILLEDGTEVDKAQDCYFMDSNSVIFASAPNFSGDAYFKYYGLVENPSPIGESYMASSTVFMSIADLISTAKRLSLKPQHLLAKGNDEFSLVIAGGGEIYFDTKKPLAGVVENFVALMKSPELKLNVSGHLPVEYIDLRFGNKLFYKLKTAN